MSYRYQGHKIPWGLHWQIHVAMVPCEISTFNYLDGRQLNSIVLTHRIDETQLQRSQHSGSRSPCLNHCWIADTWNYTKKYTISTEFRGVLLDPSQQCKHLVRVLDLRTQKYLTWSWDRIIHFRRRCKALTSCSIVITCIDIRIRHDIIMNHLRIS